MDYDLLVVGAGAAGLAAARSGRAHGARVAIIADGRVGGECTFVGCIPSKTLIEAARQGANFGAAMTKVRDTVERVAATETVDVLRGEGIDFIEGRARLAGQGRVVVSGRQVGYRRLVIATGAGPAIPSIPGVGAAEVLTNLNIFDLASRPESLLVVGGGPIGVELAQAFARLGIAVRVVETEGRLLPREEPEASALVEAALVADGVNVSTNRRVTSFDSDRVGLKARLDDGTTVIATKVLLATGRQPDATDLGLEGLGVATDHRGYITTDSRMRTNVASVYAAGDITGRAAFTHAADEMGRIAATNALARIAYRRYHDDSIPAVTFTDPEIARVGLTEDAAAAIVPGARVAYLPLNEVDRAVTAGGASGYIKLIIGPRRVTRELAGGRLVGCTIVAGRAGDMIAAPTLVMRNGMFPARLALTVQAYPTWSLGIRQAAAQLFVETGGRRSRAAQRTIAA